MSTIPKSVRKNKPAVFLALLAFTPWIARADDAADQQKNDAYRAAVAQESLQKDVASIQDKLASVREEMKDLLPQDAAMVDRAFKQLESLSKNEIDATIESLRAASRTQDVKAQLEKLSGAFEKQTAITSDLKHISVDLTARQVRDDITQKLTEILKHQVAARDEVMRVSVANPGVPPSKLHNAMERRYEVVIGDQSSITDDLKIAVKQINDAATTLPPDARAFMVNASTIITQQKLDASANDAMNFTRYGPYDRAMASQAANISTILMIIQTLDSDQKVIEQLKEIGAELTQIEKEQKALTADMAAEKGNTPSYEAQKRQIDISDRSAALSAELQGINAKAAAETRVAQGDMENAIGIASQGRHEDRGAIAPEQQKADGFLNTAKQTVDQQLAQLATAAQAPAESAAQKAAEADTLLRDVRQAANEEGGVAVTATQTPNSPFMPSLSQQQVFHDRVDTLQTRALPVSPEAAQAIGDASSQLGTAASSVQQTEIATAHQAAAADLVRAADILSQQKLAEEQKKKEDDAGTQAMQKMDAATQKTATAQPELNSASSSASAVNQLASAQADVNSAQQDAAASGASPAASSALSQASADLAAAQTAAATLQLAAAQADAKAAAAALATAKSDMQAQQAAAAAAAAAASPAASGQGQGQGKGQGPATAQAPGKGSSSGGGQPGPGETFTGHGDWFGPVQVVSGLTQHDRDAVAQLQAEKPPREFVPQVQQYYKNLADGAGQ